MTPLAGVQGSRFREIPPLSAFCRSNFSIDPIFLCLTSEIYVPRLPLGLHRVPAARVHRADVFNAAACLAFRPRSLLHTCSSIGDSDRARDVRHPRGPQDHVHCVQCGRAVYRNDI